jgi:tight adherence protein C
MTLPASPLLPLGVAVAMVSLAGSVLLRLRQRDARVSQRLRALAGWAPLHHGSGPKATKGPLLVSGFVQFVRGLGALIARSGVLSPKSITELEQTLVAAGHRPGPALPLFLGAKFGLLVLLPMLAWTWVRYMAWDSPPPGLVATGAAVLGLLLPDLVVRSLRKRYIAELERGLPDALDLLIICAEAGLPLETGLERVSHEIRESNGPAANELATTASEMKFLSDRRQALINMGLRTQLDSLVRLGGTLAQTLQYGTPLAQALRILAVEMRGEALTRFEARAARLPVLLTLPMILFILPCIIVVVGGPAIVQVSDIMGN